MRAKSDVDAMSRDLAAAFLQLRGELTDKFTTGLTARAEGALAEIETFCAVSLRVLRKTNPSKLRDAARAEEISAYLSGREVIR